MDLIVASEYNDLSRKAADFVAAAVAAKPGCNVVLPTGNTPMGLYRELIDRRSRGEFDPSGLRIFQLDEYLGLPPTISVRSTAGWRSLFSTLSAYPREMLCVLPAPRPNQRLPVAPRGGSEGGWRLRPCSARARRERAPGLQRTAREPSLTYPSGCAKKGDRRIQRKLLGRMRPSTSQGRDSRDGCAASCTADPAPCLRYTQTGSLAPHDRGPYHASPARLLLETSTQRDRIADEAAWRSDDVGPPD